MGGSSKSQTVGYRYLFTMQMGLGRGPINELIEIRVGDKMAWFGSATGSGSIAINAPELFGGDKGEGGIQGTMDICMGDKTQGQNSRMVAMRGALLSAYRGVTTFVFDGLICSMNPYPKPWKFRARRTTAGWERGNAWYPERADIYYYDDYTVLDTPTISVGYVGNPDFYDKEQWKAIVAAQQINAVEELTLRRRTINAMNPAHMLVELAITSGWGRGMPEDQIDWDSFKLAADTLYCEKFGLCLKWSRSSGVDEITGEIINTIGAFQYVSRQTGLLTLRLIRNDYDVEGLPVFTRTSGILSIESNETSGADSGFNEVIVKYRSPLTGKTAAVRYQNLGSVMSDSGVNSTTTEYLAVPDRYLALRLAARDVRSNTGDVQRLKITFDRRGFPIEPGVVFVLSDPESGIGRMVMRAVTIDNEDYVNGTITISCATDIYGLPATTYVAVDPMPEPEGNTNPQLPLDDRLVEAPYRSIYQLYDRANFEILDPHTTFLAAVAARPNQNNVAYELLSKADGENSWDDPTPAGWTEWATLKAPITPTDTVISLDLVEWPSSDLGDVAMLGSEEIGIVSVDQVNKVMVITRGCLDSVPTRHLAGERIWFYETDAARVPREFVAGEKLLAKFLPYTSTGKLLESLAPTETLQTRGRFGAPYPPAKVQMDDASIFDTYQLVDGVEVTWARRNRVTQQDAIVDHYADDITPEVGQTTSIKLFRADTDALLSTWDTLAGTSQALTITYGGEIRMEMFSARDSIESFDRYNLTFGYDGFHLQFVDGTDMLTTDNELVITQE